MSIQNKVLCVNLKTSCLGTTSTDPVLTANLREQTGAHEGSLKATKKILDEAISPFRKLRTELRKYFAGATLPGISDDLRITTPKRLEEIQAKLDDFRARDAKLLLELQANYDQHIADDKELLKAAFDPELYPQVDDLPRYFNLTLITCDMPQGDFSRVEGLTDATIDKMKADHAAMLVTVSNAAKNDVHRKLIELVTRIADNLGKDDVSKLHGTTFTNLQEYLAKVPDLNITNDPQLEAMRVEALNSLNYTMSQIKASAVLKEQATTAARGILAKFGGGTRKVLIAAPTTPEIAA